jgi:hypothetical protein
MESQFPSKFVTLHVLHKKNSHEQMCICEIACSSQFNQKTDDREKLVNYIQHLPSYV